MSKYFLIETALPLRDPLSLQQTTNSSSMSMTTFEVPS